MGDCCSASARAFAERMLEVRRADLAPRFARRAAILPRRAVAIDLTQERRAFRYSFHSVVTLFSSAPDIASLVRAPLGSDWVRCQVVAGLDYMATFAAFAGVKLPDKDRVDSNPMSASGLLRHIAVPRGLGRYRGKADIAFVASPAGSMGTRPISYCVSAAKCGVCPRFSPDFASLLRAALLLRVCNQTTIKHRASRCRDPRCSTDKSRRSEGAPARWRCPRSWH